MKLDEAIEKYQFLNEIWIDPHIQLEVELPEIYDEFMKQSLIENESEALGHPHVKKDLYFVRKGKLNAVDVKRTSTKIYPPGYLRPGMDLPEDEFGSSETVRENLIRRNLSNVEYIVLYTRVSGGRSGDINKIQVVQIKEDTLEKHHLVKPVEVT